MTSGCMALSVAAVSISVSPLLHRRGADRHVGDLRAEPLAGDLEARLRAGRRLEEQVDLGLCGVDYLDRGGRGPSASRWCCTSTRSRQKHHVRLKTPVPETDPKLRHPHRRLQGRQLVRARGLGPLRHRLRRAIPNLIRILTHDDFVGHPMRKDYPTGEAPRPQEAPRSGCSTSRGVGAPRPQHRPLPPGHARDLPGPGAAGRRDHQGRRSGDRLPAPQLREDGGGADLLADHPLHRSPQLLLGLHQRPRLGPGGGEAPRRGRPAAGRSHSRDPLRVLAGSWTTSSASARTWSTSGAITPFFVVFRAREEIYDLLEACCGARLTVSYVRIGGLAQDVPDDFEARCRKALASDRGGLDQLARAS